MRRASAGANYTWVMQMKKTLKDVTFYTYKYGFTYAHERGNYVFSAEWHWCRFKVGADWFFAKWKVQELNINLGFVELNWTRILP